MLVRLPLIALCVLATLLSQACRQAPQTPVRQAAASGDLATLDRLLDAGADPAGGGATRSLSALVWAARTGRVPVIRRLAARGLPLDAPSGINGWTPLEHALHKEQSAAALALLDLGVDVRGRKGLRPLAMAAGYGNAALVAALLSRGADPTLDLPGGPSLVGLAAAGAWDVDYRFAGCDRHARTLEVLLRAAPQLRLTDSWWDRLALHYARWRHCTAIVDQLASR